MSKFRAEVTGIREMTWSCNSLEYDTPQEAEAWLKGLAGRWTGYDMSRVVPVDTPMNQPVNFDTDTFFQNFRG